MHSVEIAFEISNFDFFPGLVICSQTLFLDATVANHSSPASRAIPRGTTKILWQTVLLSYV
jgi:hypothetical protein